MMMITLLVTNYFIRKALESFLLQGDVDDNVDGLKVELVGGNLPLRPCQPGDHRGEIVIIIIIMIMIKLIII